MIHPPLGYPVWYVPLSAATVELLTARLFLSSSSELAKRANILWKEKEQGELAERAEAIVERTKTALVR